MKLVGRIYEVFSRMRKKRTREEKVLVVNEINIFFRKKLYTVFITKH